MSGRPAPRRPGLPAVTIIVPTRNESPNVEVLVQRVAGAMHDVAQWELLFVDDSDDDTPAAVEALRARGWPVRLHHRPPAWRAGGLSGAVEEGFDTAAADVLAVMDADLQHPPEVLPGLLAPLLAGEADLVAGTRYGGTGQASGLSGPWRRAVSSGSRLLVHALVPRSRPLTDPMSGLFAVHRSVIEGVTLQANGFKILLEVVTRGRWERVRNHPYTFQRRHAGRSKASLHEGLLFARHLIRLAGTGHEEPQPLRVTSPEGASPARRSSA